MRIIISGLETKAGLAYMADAFPLQYDVQWNDTNEFFAKAEDEAGEESVQWVWLYRAPWAFLPSTAAKQLISEVMLQWQSEQRRILQLRRHLRNRLILVNLDRVDVHALAQHLGMETSQSSSRDSEEVLASPLTTVLGALFEQVAPDYWTLYETLEAAAWLPKGEPEFRSTRAVPSVEGLEELLKFLHAGRQIPQMLQQVEERRQQAIQDSEVSRQAALVAETTCHTLIETQQRLQINVRDTTQQLEEARAQVQQLIGELDAARNALAQAEQRCRQMEQAHDILKKQLADNDARTRAAGEESKSLLTQLHQVQEELERYYLDGMAMKKTHADLEQQLDQLLNTQKQLTQERDAACNAMDEVKVARKKLVDEYAHVQKKLAHERDVAQKAAAKSKDELKKLAEDLVRLQKQHVDDSKRLEQAVIIQKQFLQERDVAREAVAQAAELRETLMEEQRLLQKQLNEASSAVQTAQEERELVLAQLHDVQEELEVYYLANRQILAAMEQSETTMDRARKAIIRLAHG